MDLVANFIVAVNKAFRGFAAVVFVVDGGGGARLVAALAGCPGTHELGHTLDMPEHVFHAVVAQREVWAAWDGEEGREGAGSALRQQARPSSRGEA